MGLLDSVLGSVLGGQSQTNQTTGGLGSLAGSPLVGALISLFASRAMSGGGLGGMLGNAMGNSQTGAAGGGGMLGGALGNLLEQFQQNGHGDVMRSWIGNGPNQSISPTQLGQALGPDTVSDLSDKTGLPANDLTEQLARVFPSIVDKLTPHGRLPTPDEESRWV